MEQGDTLLHPPLRVFLEGFAYKASGCRACKEYVGLIPEDPLLVAVFAVSVLVLLSAFPAREM